jgi:hypothetical protein
VKMFGIVNIGMLPLLLEAMTPGYAQHDQREPESRHPNQEQEAKPERQQPQQNPERQKPSPSPGKQPQQPKPERPQHQQKPVGQEEPRHPQGPVSKRQPQPANPTHPDEQQRTQGQQQRQQPAHRPVQQVQRDYESQHRGAWLDRRAHNWQSEHRSWQQRGGYTGYRIPDVRYRDSFGPSHSFRMFSFPLLVVSGFPRFQYGGLWFSVMDPWPEYWSNNWYDSDDLYVEFYGGGYYLRNRMHPRDRMALTVFVN